MIAAGEDKLRFKPSKKFLGVRKIKDGIYEINFQLPNKGPRIFRRIKASSTYEAYQEKAIAHFKSSATQQRKKIPLS